MLVRIGQDKMNRLANEGVLDRLTKVKLPKCESCLIGKVTAKSFAKAIRL